MRFLREPPGAENPTDQIAKRLENGRNFIETRGDKTVPSLSFLHFDEGQELNH
jgi:hypothetical protein